MKKYIGTFLKLLLASFVISVALLFLLAFFLYKFRLSDDIVTAAIIIIYVISNFLAGFMAGKVAKQQKYLWGLGIGTAYFIVLCLVSFLVRQSFAGLGQDFLMTMFLCLGSGMLGGMVS
nr:TIGR04086 family membrane protein [Lachnospiraceae bacterium]